MNGVPRRRGRPPKYAPVIRSPLPTLAEIDAARMASEEGVPRNRLLLVEEPEPAKTEQEVAVIEIADEWAKPVVAPPPRKPMIVYLVAPTLDEAVALSAERGWTRIALARFCTQHRDDVRVVTRMSELVPFAGMTKLVRAGDGALSARLQAEFDDFVRSGAAEWIDL